MTSYNNASTNIEQNDQTYSHAQERQHADTERDTRLVQTQQRQDMSENVIVCDPLVNRQSNTTQSYLTLLHCPEESQEMSGQFLTYLTPTVNSERSESDLARLASGGEPWPTGLQRANLGEGLYAWGTQAYAAAYRSEEHTSELQSL